MAQTPDGEGIAAHPGLDSPTTYEPRRRPDDGTVYEGHSPAARTTHEAGHTSSSPPAWFQVVLPDRLAADYELVKTLSVQGSQSAVVRARPRVGGPEVAIKLYYDDGGGVDDDALRAVQGIDSDHVVRVLRFDRIPGLVFEVLEFLPQGTLRDALRARTTGLPTEQVRQILTDLCAGLEVVHQAGLIHRDLKPENLFVRTASPWRLAIGDFGVARRQDVSRVMGSVAGTMPYMAPEAAEGATMRPGDWWSLGIITAELLTGRHPLAHAHGLLPSASGRAALPVEGLDDRWALLCRGLLTVREDKRWGAPQVKDWLRGGSPEVVAEHPSPSPGSSSRPGAFPFVNRDHPTPKALAEAFRSETNAAEDLVADPRARDRLRKWLGEHGLSRATDALLAGEPDPVPTVIALQVIMDPTITPRLRRVDLSAAGLAEQAERARRGQADAAAWIRDVRRHQVLQELASYRLESSGIGIIGERLRTWWAQIEALPPATRSQLASQLDRAEGALLAAAVSDKGRSRQAADNRKILRRVSSTTSAFASAAHGIADRDTDEAIGVRTLFALSLPAAVAARHAADSEQRAQRAAARRRGARRNFRAGLNHAVAWMAVPTAGVVVLTLVSGQADSLKQVAIWVAAVLLFGGALGAFRPHWHTRGTVTGIALGLLWWIGMSGPWMETFIATTWAPPEVWRSLFAVMGFGIFLGWLAAVLPTARIEPAWELAAWVAIPLLWLATASSIVDRYIGGYLMDAYAGTPEWYQSAVSSVLDWVEPVRSLVPPGLLPTAGVLMVAVGSVLLIVLPSTRLASRPAGAVLALAWIPALLIVLSNAAYLAMPVFAVGAVIAGIALVAAIFAATVFVLGAMAS